MINKFITACEHGNLNKAKELLNNNPNINISACSELAFRLACHNGYFKVVEWLLQIKPTIDVSIQYNYAFDVACTNCHLKIAQLILKYNPTICINTYNYIFKKNLRKRAFKSCTMVNQY